MISKEMTNLPYLNSEENGPTPERAAKSMFSGGRPAREQTIVDALLKAGEITQDCANAADRWYQTWIFAYHGYKEFPDNYVANAEIKHDDLSWLMTRADAAGQLFDVRHALGICTEVRLKAMLVEKLSSRKMASSLFPTISADLGRKKVSAQCAMVLEQLAEFYANQRRDRRGEQRACTRVPFPV
ncbi:hypothetical protein [Acetobacter vaccinii]|uniref:Uncharacterized protein n=1 Tax=Acetobacter vaccinii TaxID=2592655 RepID=A0A5C1YRV1_9PROT|nr:hypothetical protein [Acetobacter vaccinii]QEO17840.1 hypothetical protein FLP30_08935 [Acetobacter vaccinii]